VLHGAIAGGQPGADLVGVIVERAHAAAIGDAAGFVYDVEALGPGGVSIVGSVIDVVDAERDGVVETPDEIVGDGYALGESFRLGVTDIVLYVGLHLPLVGRVGFADVDGQEVGVIFVVVVNLHHVTDVAAEGRSSVAAEDDDEGAGAGAFADVKAIRTIESDQARVGGVIADFERAAVHVRQGIAHHAVGVLRAAGHFAENEESGKQQDQENRNCPFPEERHRKLFQLLSNVSTRNFRGKESYFRFTPEARDHGKET
jgi:hypothetical protein